MANDQKRYQVFVSSTYLDLKLERKAVIAALLECDAFPARMELFPAADDDAWTLIKRVIDDSDYYLLVIGGKYGSLDPVDDVGYTEKEYDYAVKQGKPVMAFLHAKPEQIPMVLSESTEAMQAKLSAFREKVRSSKHVKFWDGPDSLAGQVALSFNRFIRSYPAVGWVRADTLTNAQSLQALADAHARIEDLQQQLGAVRTGPPPGTEGLAQGSEEFTLPFLVRGSYKNANGGQTSAAEWVFLSVEWNEVFAAIGPSLLQECEESALRDALQSQVGLLKYMELRDGFQQSIMNKHTAVSANTIRITSREVDDEDFGTVLVQLMALGLIEKSSRKRSVNDTRSYWSLTPFGQTRVIQLRALKTSQTNLGSAAGLEEASADVNDQPVDEG
ncbi:MAG TPA: DUF4062 domain-containing protein [Jatrophihabitans sp.]|uniref:DUF4062 domain-containing protein n=1 Tax=Jatrophihabitans sp. TaxID=1932789 RepID=UPI002F078704